jgi:hypothetical protein
MGTPTIPIPIVYEADGHHFSIGPTAPGVGSAVAGIIADAMNLERVIGAEYATTGSAAAFSAAQMPFLTRRSCA